MSDFVQENECPYTEKFNESNFSNQFKFIPTLKIPTSLTKFHVTVKVTCALVTELPKNAVVKSLS